MGKRIGKRRRALWVFGGLLSIALACGGRTISVAGSGGEADDSTSAVTSAVSGMGAASAIGSSAGMVNTITSTHSTVTTTLGTGAVVTGASVTGASTGFGAGGMTGAGAGPGTVVTGGSIPGSCSYPIDLGTGMTSYASYAPSGPNEFSGECGGLGYETYFVWQATEAGLYSISTLGSEFDTVLYQFDMPNCSGTGVLQCNDDTSDGRLAELLVEAEAGEQVSFMLDSYDGNWGIYQLQIAWVADTACPEPLMVLEGVGNPLVEGEIPFDDPSLNDPGRDGCNGGPPRLRFDWIAPDDGVYRFDTYGSNYDTVLTLRPGCTPSRVDTCNDDAGPTLGSEVRAELAAGQRVRLEIAAYGGEIYVEGGDDPFYRLSVSQF